MNYMAKTKKVYVDCTACKKTIQVTLASDLAQGKDYFPFEYLDVHGNPEHALLMFLDANLSVRGQRVYEDLKVAKQDRKYFENINRMSENEILASIFEDPLKYKLYHMLTEGPKTDEELIEALKKLKGFNENMFSILVMPFIKIGLIKTAWLKERPVDCYFLVKDFAITRVPASLVPKRISADKNFKALKDTYKERVLMAMHNHINRVQASEESRFMEMKRAFTYLNDMDNRKIFRELRLEPVNEKKLLEECDETTLKKLVKDEMIGVFPLNGVTYYALLCDLKIEIFQPQYMLHVIADQVSLKDITKEMAMIHLNMLYDAK